MKFIKECSLLDFEAWSGAVDTKERIIAEGKEEQFDDYIDEMFPNGATETDINDVLWFESESIFEYLNITDDGDDDDDDGEFQRCNHCMTVFDKDCKVCPECGKDDALCYPFERSDDDKYQNFADFCNCHTCDACKYGPNPVGNIAGCEKAWNAENSKE